MKNSHSDNPLPKNIEERGSGIFLGLFQLEGRSECFIKANFKERAKQLARTTGVGFEWVVADPEQVIGISLYGSAGRIKAFMRKGAPEFHQTIGLLHDATGTWRLLDLTAPQKVQIYEVGITNLDTLVSLILAQSQFLTPGASQEFQVSTPDYIIIPKLRHALLEDEPGWLDRWGKHVQAGGAPH